MPPFDESLGRLKRAGWSVGHAAFGATWQVDGTKCCSATPRCQRK
jgi:hypothetical protein